MKINKLVLLSLATVTLFGCSPFSKPKKDENKPVENTYVQNGAFFLQDSNLDTVHSGYEFYPTKKGPTGKPKTGTAEINLYAFNDFHGAVLERTSEDAYGNPKNEAGLAQIASFFKKVGQEPNTIVLDQGDTWQGGFESNYDYGATVQDVFDASYVSVRTVGNHDFDWGQKKLANLTSPRSRRDYTACLAANVYNYENKHDGNVQQVQFGKEYATFYLQNGVKVGVVGVIGRGQIESISSQLVDNICFTDATNKIKEISDYLRTKKECDIVVASVHDYYENYMGRGLINVSPVSNKRYIDLLLSGHAHSKKSDSEGNVKFLRWDSNGESVGKVTLKYDFGSKKVVDSETKVDTYYKKYLNTYYPIDSEIKSMVDQHLANLNFYGRQVVHPDLGSESYDTVQLARLMATSIADFAKKEGIEYSIVNYAREGFAGGQMTYSDLYRCFPFDNQIVIADIAGSEIKDAFDGGGIYFHRVNTDEPLNKFKTYKIAVLDYVGLHKNVDRQYDNFPSIGLESSNAKIYNGGFVSNPYIYRDLLKYYLEHHQEDTFIASDFNSSNPHYNYNSL